MCSEGYASGSRCQFYFPLNRFPLTFLAIGRNKQAEQTSVQGFCFGVHMLSSCNKQRCYSLLT